MSEKGPKPRTVYTPEEGRITVTTPDGSVTTTMDALDADNVVVGQQFDGPVTFDETTGRFVPDSEPPESAPTPKDVFEGKQPSFVPRTYNLSDGDTKIVISGRNKITGNYFGREIYGDGSSQQVEFSPEELEGLERDLADTSRAGVAREALEQADAEIAADASPTDEGATAQAGLTEAERARLRSIAAGHSTAGAVDEPPHTGGLTQRQIEALQALAAGQDKYKDKDKEPQPDSESEWPEPEEPEPTPEEPAQTPELDDAAIETARQALEQAVIDELDRSPEGLALGYAVEEYARCKADVETKFGRIGRRKRETALKTAQEGLVDAQLAYSRLLVKVRESKGLYEGSVAEVRRQRSDDFFDSVRSLNTSARRATVRERSSRIEDRNMLQRGLVAVGTFVNGGKSKWGQRIRAGGTGFGAGAALAGAKTAGVALFGMSFPLTAAALAAGAGVYRGVSYGSRVAELDASLGDQKSALELTQREPVVDESVREADAKLHEIGQVNDRAREIIRGSFAEHRREGDANLDAARAKARTTMKRFGVGMLAGAATVSAGVGAHSMFSGSEVSASGPNGAEFDSNTSANAHGGGDIFTPNQPPAGYEFPAGSDVIRDGQGFIETFRNMGLSADQAQSMLGDRGLMDELIRQGVAYPDQSIGGYGISEPGRLSGQAMDTIRQAIITKGY